MTYGEKIAYLRKSKGMTQEELGKVLSVTYQAVSKWERSESLPDFATMSQIAKFFQVPLDYFDSDETAAPEQPAHAETEPDANIIGMCTVCGRVLKTGDEYSVSPKMVCGDCAARMEREELAARQRAEESARREAEAERSKKRAMIAREAHEVIGTGFDAKLIVSLIIAAITYVAITVSCFTSGEDVFMLGAVLMVAPLAAFAVPMIISGFIAMLRDKDDDDEIGYKLSLSLIIGGVFAVANIALSLTLYLTLEQNGYFFAIMAIGAIVGFTFISQYMWGSSVKDIFTCGGFTFKLPGVIFSLTPESIIMMIIIKVLLGFLSILVFIVTTVFFALVAIFGSVFTFIPCIIFKLARDSKAKGELKKA